MGFVTQEGYTAFPLYTPFEATSFANGDPVNFSDPFGLAADTLELQTHEVTLGRHHASIRITPKDQRAWAGGSRFKSGATGRVSATLGAGPAGFCWVSACLVSAFNRPRDAEAHVGSTGIGIGDQDENSVIASLLAADQAYGDNLVYQFFPSRPVGGYNSNSYVSGLLRKVGLKVAPPAVPLPGWEKPIPIP